MSVTYTESVAGEIRAELARQRVTQRDLAIRTGFTQQYLSRRLTGSMPLSTEDIETIAAALGVAITELASPRAATG